MTNKKKILIILAIISAIVVSFIGGQSFAKYISEVKGHGVAEVASWSFKVNGQEEQTQTIQLTSTYDSKTLVNNKIAPGTKGSFNIIIDANGSDVGIDYTVKIANEKNKPNNLKFIYEDVEYNTITELEKVLSGTINADDKNKERTLTIDWMWKYETGSNATQIAENDAIDTNDGKTITDYTFDVIVSGVQVMPQDA